MSSSTSVSSPLERIGRGLEEASNAATALVGRTSAEALVLRPGPEGWSAAECLAHLTLTARAYLPLLDGAIAEARRRGGPGAGNPRMDWVGWLLRAALDAPGRFKTRTIPAFVPQSAQADRILREFLASQHELLERLQAAEGLALDRVKVASPFNSRIRYNLLSAFEIILTHERRHLRQAEQALAAGHSR